MLNKQIISIMVPCQQSQYFDLYQIYMLIRVYFHYLVDTGLGVFKIQ